MFKALFDYYYYCSCCCYCYHESSQQSTSNTLLCAILAAAVYVGKNLTTAKNASEKSQKKLVDALSDGTWRISAALRCCIVSNFLFIRVNFNDRPYFALTAMEQTSFFHRGFIVNVIRFSVTQSLVQQQTHIYTVSSVPFRQHCRRQFFYFFPQRRAFCSFSARFHSAHSPVTQISDCTWELIVSRNLPSCFTLFLLRNFTHFFHSSSLTSRWIGTTCTMIVAYYHRRILIKIECYDISLTWSIYDVVACWRTGTSKNLFHFPSWRHPWCIFFICSNWHLWRIPSSLKVNGDCKLVRRRHRRQRAARRRLYMYLCSFMQMKFMIIVNCAW